MVSALSQAKPDLSVDEAKNIVNTTYLELFPVDGGYTDRFSMMGYTVLLDTTIPLNNNAFDQQLLSLRYLMPQNALEQYLEFLCIKIGTEPKRAREIAVKTVKPIVNSSWV